MIKSIQAVRAFLEHPLKVGIAAVAVAFASLLSEGSLINLWNLKVEKQKMTERYKLVSEKNILLKSRIEKAQNSERFIGHEAREKLELVGEDELVFIFDN